MFPLSVEWVLGRLFDWPRKTPISSTGRFRWFFSILAVLSAFSLLAVAIGETQKVTARTSIIILALTIGGIMGGVFTYRWPLGSAESKDGTRVLFSYLVLILGVRYGLHYFLEVSLPTLAFVAFAGAQAAMLAGFVGVFANPIIPEARWGFTSKDERDEYLCVHLTNWWRVGQFFITFGLTIGVTLLINVVPSVSSVPGMSAVAWLAFPFGLQIPLIMVYIRWKMIYVERVLVR